MSLETFMGLIAAAGLGSVITVLVQDFLQSKRKAQRKVFDERKEAYLGLLRALRDAAVTPSEKASKEYAYWQLLCELISESAVGEAIQSLVDTNDDPGKRAIEFENLKRVLRAGLGLAL